MVTIPTRSPRPSRRRSTSDRPTLIACKTVIGYGAPTKQGKASTHGEPLGADEIKGAREKLGWAHAAFEVPADVLAAWRAAGARGAGSAQGLGAARGQARAGGSARSDRRSRRPRPSRRPSPRSRRSSSAAPPKLATRQSSQKVLEKLVPVLPALIGGSADLTGSNGTRTKHHTSVAAG